METKYFRTAHVIRDAENNLVFTGTFGSGDYKKPSINEAKRESRRLQGSALGQGLLRVERG